MKRVMKRAMADRAISASSGSPPGPDVTATTATSSLQQPPNGRIGHVSSSSEGQPPLKIPRIGESSSAIKKEQAPPAIVAPSVTAPVSSSTVKPTIPPSPRPRPEPSSSRSASTTPASNKRPRRASSSNRAGADSDEENDSSSAFFLQHQNRALAIELKSLQAQLRDLTQERELRRRSCLQAVQALHSLQATWTSLETALGQDSPPAIPLSPLAADMPSSTVGETDETAIEWTTALHRALQQLANQPGTANSLPSEEIGSDGDILTVSPSSAARRQGEMKLGELAANITGRANCLEKWLWEVLRAKKLKLPPSDLENEEFLKSKKAEIEHELEQLKTQVLELTHGRDDFKARERRLRRNIYRLDVGMISQDQLIKSVIGGPGSEMNDDPDRLAVQKEAILSGASQDTTANTDEKSEATNGNANGAVSSKVVLGLQRELEETKQEVAIRDKSIDQMNSRIRELEKRVSELSVRQQSEGDKEKLESYESTALKLKVAENEISELRERLEKARDKWAQSAGNEKAAIEALEELQEQHRKRWTELTSLGENEEDTKELTLLEQQARKIAELEHKLCQALENVRQAESVRTNLRDALSMNESLQENLAELKEMQENSEMEEKSEKNDNNPTTPANNRTDGRNEGHSSQHRRDSSEKMSSEKAEKLYRENKKMRKDIVALMASKESHKAKAERLEKERNSLTDVNIRLMKQVSEKEEMNAKSLSSILHLKSVTEQLGQERENLEQQAKSAEQLALAARLATNAKERMSEEIMKEKGALEEEMKELEKSYFETKKELSQKTAECADSSGKMSTLNAELANALKRCDEFVVKNEEQSGEIRKLLDALDKAERTAKESREKLAEIAQNSPAATSSSSSGFTADQLKTQVQVLKNRLACPVCHYRDKECIIMRCRHMHCKQCVEERLSNRSRRCPTCNNPFGRTDVEDIFLG